MIDINNIFDLFKDDLSKNDKIDYTLIDFSDHPLLWINGFNKTMNNYLFFIGYISKTFKNIPGVDDLDVNKAGSFLMHEKAWEFIKKVNIDDQYHLECIKMKSSKSFLSSIKASILFFQELEDFEKCAFLKQIEEKIYLNLEH